MPMILYFKPEEKSTAVTPVDKGMLSREAQKLSI
jgi:hypothetical protein